MVTGKYMQIVTKYKCFSIGIAEKDADRLHKFYCPSCRDRTPDLEIVWWPQCFNCERPLIAKEGESLGPSKYCSDECGILMARKRLAKLLATSNTLKSFTMDEWNPNMQQRRDELQKLIALKEARLTEFDARQNIVNDTVLLADYLSDMLQMPICGFDQALITFTGMIDTISSFAFSQLVEFDGRQQAEEFAQQKVCCQQRNKCSLHNFAHIPTKSNFAPTLPIYFKLPATVDKSQYPVPNWSHLHSHMISVEREEWQRGIDALKQELSQLNADDAASVMQIDLKLDSGENAALVCRVKYPNADAAQPSTLQAGITLSI
jgi:hypothetical protein